MAQSAFEAGRRLGQPALLIAHGTKAIMSLGIVRLEGQGPFGAGCRLVQAPWSLRTKPRL